MDRRIFGYNDGETHVFADPTEIDYVLNKLGVEQLLFSARLLDMPTKEDGSVDFDNSDPNDVRLMLDSYHDAEPMIRQAFRIKPFDRATGKGLLYQEVIDLMSSYFEWRSDIKKKVPSPPDSSGPTA